MPTKQLEPADQRPDDNRRVARMAAPWVVGGMTAIVAGLTSSLDVLNLPVEVGFGITGVAAVIAGLVACPTQHAAVPEEPKPRRNATEPLLPPSSRTRSHSGSPTGSSSAPRGVVRRSTPLPVPPAAW